MKTRFLYVVALVSLASYMGAQEIEDEGPQPHEVLPATSMSNEDMVTPELPSMPEPPAFVEADVEDHVTDKTEESAQEEFATQSAQGHQFEIQIQTQEEKNSLVNIGLEENVRKQVVEALTVLLADEYLLYTKTLKYHWNVRGKHFGPLHELFSKQYEALQGFVDMVAERIRALGFMAPGTFKEFTQFATLHEQADRNPKDLEMISDLLKDHEQIIRTMRSSIDLTSKLNDMGTNNFLQELLVKHEKMAWMLRAHLEQ